MEKNEKRILCVIGQLGNGGSEKQMYLFLRHLDRKAYKAHVLVSSKADGIWNQRIQQLDVGVSSLEGINPLMKFIALRKFADQFKPDAIFSWSFFTNPFVLSGHRNLFTGSLRNSYASCMKSSGFLRCRLALMPNRLIVNSSTIKDELVRMGVKESKIRPIFNIFEPTFTNNSLPFPDKGGLRRQWNIPDDAVVICGAGRNSPTKDFPFFLDSIEEAIRKSPEGLKIHALVIGSGGTAMQSEIDKRGLSKFFTITGEIKDAKNLMPCADIFFLSSSDEGMPNVMLEAVDAKLPIIARKSVGGASDILGKAFDEFGGELMLNERSVSEAASKLINLVTNRDLRIKASDSSVRNLESFLPHKIVPQYLDTIFPKL